MSGGCTLRTPLLTLVFVSQVRLQETKKLVLSAVSTLAIKSLKLHFSKGQNVWTGNHGHYLCRDNLCFGGCVILIPCQKTSNNRDNSSLALVYG